MAETNLISTFLLRSFIKSNHFHPSRVNYCLEEPSEQEQKPTPEVLASAVQLTHIEVKHAEVLEQVREQPQQRQRQQRHEDQQFKELSYKATVKSKDCGHSAAQTTLEGFGYKAVLRYVLMPGEHRVGVQFDLKLEIRDLITEETISVIQRDKVDMVARNYGRISAFNQLLCDITNSGLNTTEGVIAQEGSGVIEFTDSARFFEVIFREVHYKFDKFAAVELDSPGLEIRQRLAKLVLSKPLSMEEFIDKFGDRFGATGFRFGLQINGLLRILILSRESSQDPQTAANHTACFENLYSKLQLLRVLILDAIPETCNGFGVRTKVEKIKSLIEALSDASHECHSSRQDILKELAAYDWTHLMIQFNAHTDPELVNFATTEPSVKFIFEKANVSGTSSELEKTLCSLVHEKYEIKNPANYHSNTIKTLENKMFVVTIESDHFRFRKTTQHNKDAYLVFLSDEIERER